MILILNNDNFDLNKLILKNNKLCFYFNENKMNGLYLKYSKEMIEIENKYYLKLNKRMISIFEKMNIKHRIKIINREYFIDIIKNDITKNIYDDQKEYLILSFKSTNDNNYIKIHISQWKAQD